MTAGYHDANEIRDEDRLPWLETAEEEPRDGMPVGRLVALVAAGLGLLALLLFGVFKFQERQALSASMPELISAPEGDYKVRPDAPGGMKIEGQGDTAFQTSEGKAPNGSIDLGSIAEAPVEGKRAGAAAPGAAPQSKAVTEVPRSGGPLVATTPVRAPAATIAGVPGQASQGTMIQIGAFASEAAANAEWARLSKRFAFLAPLGKTIMPVTAGSTTRYRLRANAGSNGQADGFCRKLIVAGENCFIAT